MINSEELQTRLLSEIRRVLKEFPTYWDDKGDLIESKLVNDLREYKADILQALLANELINSTYSIKVNNSTIFKTDEFVSMLRFKRYWGSDYTKYTNEIGLTSEGKYLQYSEDVVLDFPYKDSVLEAGMSNEDVGKDEVFYHNILAKEEIDNLLGPKVLTNMKRYDGNGEHEIIDFKDSDNLLIKGNNLIALNLLKERYFGKAKLIFIDPPYNTGSDSFKYNDSFNRSTWLTFMNNRLRVAKDLLSDDGLIWIQINDEELNYLGVLLDEIFGSDNFINIITVKTKVGGVSGSSEGKSFRDSTEFIFVYSKNKFNVSLTPVFKKTPVYELVEEYAEEGKSWKYTQVLLSLGEPKEIKSSDGYTYKHYPKVKLTSVRAFANDNNIETEDVYNQHSEKIFRTTNAQSSVRKRVMNELEQITEGIVSVTYKPIKGKNKGKLTEIFYNASNKDMFMFLSDMLEEQNGEFFYKQRLTNLWEDIQYNNLKKEGKVDFPNGKKPEKLLLNAILTSTDEKDLVIDFFAGSGSSLAVAHKTKRQYIGIEQLDYIKNITSKRLRNVIEGEQGGVSQEVEWQGGGSFVYAELYELNQKHIQDILAIEDEIELELILDELLETEYLNFKVDFEKLSADSGSFKNLTLEQKKELIIQVLDLNQLYLNYSEIDDEKYNISEGVKQFNHSFYQSEVNGNDKA